MNPTNKETQNQNSDNKDSSINITDLNSIQKTIQSLRDEIDKLKELIKSHNHDGQDGTKILENSINLKPSEIIQLGNFRLEEISDKLAPDVQQGFLIVGKDKEDTRDSDNTQIIIEHQGNTDGSTNQTFFYGQRNPLKTGTNGSITSGGSTFSTSEIKFDNDELIGAQLVVYTSDLSSFNSRYITDNTTNSITIQGTWSFTNSKALWVVIMPVYLGSAPYPWRQIYAGGESVANSGNQRRAIRLGHGITSSCQAIYFGSGSPESVVTAVVGSLYLRSDGGATTTLYVKTSGTGSTGWTAK